MLSSKFALICALALPLAAQVPMIIDDDCSTDYCPVVAPFKLWDQGKITVLAFIADTTDTYAAPTFRVHSMYYQHATVPVYANQQNTPNNANCTTNSCNGPRANQATLISTFNPGDTKANYTDCLTGYRTILAANTNVVIVATGFATCLYQLMTSSADGISSLTGAQLIQANVSKLVLCCGENPTGSEWNFENDPVDWNYLFANWTSQNGYPPIWMFSDADASGTAFGPPAYALSTVNTELKQWLLYGFTTRPVWDEATVFLAYCGLACGGTTYWADAGNGTMTVNSAVNTPINGQAMGYNSWSTGTASGHHYVTNVASATVLSHLFDGYSYGFGFAALPPLANTGSMGNGGVAFNGGMTVQ
jgi:hypothetical protein